MMNEETGSASLIDIPARRQFIVGATVVIGTLGAQAARAQTAAQQATTSASTTGTECKRTTLHQVVDLNATSKRVYETLLDSAQFTAFSGAPAQIDGIAGGTFSLFGNLVVGRNIELVANERIVQAWRPADWTPGVYSLVKFELLARGSQTQLVLDHTGFPAGGFEHLSSGWKSHYWDPLRKYLV
jgi:activator of HSP90 ATPase